ncbi:MAG: hypothetical protein ACJ784_02070 [Myxococcales bacterium]
MKSSHRSFLTLAALAAGCALFLGGEAHAATNSIVVPVSGTAGGAAFSGTATVETTLVLDEFGGAPSVIVSVHLNNVVARGATGPLLSGSGEAVLIRPLAASDSVDVSAALDAPGNAPGTATRTATAHLALRLDPVTGAALGVTAVFGAAL